MYLDQIASPYTILCWLKTLNFRTCCKFELFELYGGGGPVVKSLCKRGSSWALEPEFVDLWLDTSNIIYNHLIKYHQPDWTIATDVHGE